MKIYIFGAGASLGSQSPELLKSDPLRSPLVDEIFDPRYVDQSLYILNKKQLDYFRDNIEKRKDKSVEKWLEEQWNITENIKPIQVKNSHIRLFGRILLYLWNVMRNVSRSYNDDNTYREFLKNIQEQGEEFGIISFNYDTLLDKAFQDVFNKAFINIDGYLEENFVKPHGSINWILLKRNSDPDVPRIHDTRLRISMAMDHFFTNGPIPIINLEVIDPHLEALRENNIAAAWERLTPTYFYPLVFMPLAQKNLSHVHQFQEKIISKAEKILTQADEIYVIGYRAQDMIIKDLFRFAPKDTPLHVISDKSAESISSEVLGWANNLSKGSLINGGFSEFNKLHFKKPGEF